MPGLLLLYGAKMQQPLHLGLPFATKQPSPALTVAKKLVRREVRARGEEEPHLPGEEHSSPHPCPSCQSRFGRFGGSQGRDNYSPTLPHSLLLLIYVAMSSSVLKLVHAQLQQAELLILSLQCSKFLPC